MLQEEYYTSTTTTTTNYYTSSLVPLNGDGLGVGEVGGPEISVHFSGTSRIYRGVSLLRAPCLLFSHALPTPPPPPTRCLLIPFLAAPFGSPLFFRCRHLPSFLSYVYDLFHLSLSSSPSSALSLSLSVSSVENYSL